MPLKPQRSFSLRKVVVAPVFELNDVDMYVRIQHCFKVIIRQQFVTELSVLGEDEVPVVSRLGVT